jgi:hypothetical protein
MKKYLVIIVGTIFILAAWYYGSRQKLTAKVEAIDTTSTAKPQKAHAALSAYPDSIYTDTLKVSCRQIVFFMPTQKEFDAMVAKEGEDSGTNSIVEDFSDYMGRVVDSLKRSPWLKTTITNKHIIAVILANGQKTIVNRTKGDTLVGSILCDEVKKPQIDYGVATDTDYWAMIDNYYGKNMKH